jgi:hypothetical protein
VSNAKRKALGVLAVTIVLASIAVQVSLIAYFWWTFDARTSCDRLARWDEWIACLHGRSHLHIGLAEMAVVSWMVGGIAWLLGRFVSPYISVIAPGAGAAAFILFAINYWGETVAPYALFGEPIFMDILKFAIEIGLIGILLLGPMVGSWLSGLHARARQRSLWPSTAA